MRAMDRVFNKRVTDRMVRHNLCICMGAATKPCHLQANYLVMYTNIFWPIGVQLMTYAMGKCN